MGQLACLSLFAMAGSPSGIGASRAKHHSITIIVSGQSNAAGGSIGPGPGPDARIKAYDPAQKKYVIAQDPLPFWTDIAPKSTGAWVRLGRRLLNRYNTINLVGAGRYGQFISYWDAGNEGWTFLSENIKAVGRKADYFIWYQGESDSIDYKYSSVYLAKLTDLIARIRSITRPNLPVFIVQLADTNLPEFSEMPTIRRAQYDYCVSDDNAFLIQTLGFPLRQDDGLHLTIPGIEMLARACAKQIR